MPAHSIFGFSGADRWVPCPGSPTLSLHYPDEDGEAARTGRAVHKVGESIVVAGTRGLQTEYAPGDIVDDVEITEDRFEAAQMYGEHCIGLMRQYGIFGGPNLFIERKVSASRRIDPAAWGTLDFGLFHKRSRTLHITDGKFGWGIVEPTCLQVAGYAIGLLEEICTPESGIGDDEITVVLEIVQPFPHHPEGRIRSIKVNGADLRAVANRMREAIWQGTGRRGDVPLRAGNHCDHCPARAGCPTLRRAGLSSLDYAGKAVREELPPNEFRAELRALERARDFLDYRIEGLQEQAINRVRSGEDLDGLTIEVGKGRETWSRKPESVIAMFETMGYDVKKGTEPVTPNQAIKNRKVPSEIVRQFTHRPEKGFKLIDSEKSLAARAFSKSTNEG